MVWLPSRGTLVYLCIAPVSVTILSLFIALPLRIHIMLSYVAIDQQNAMPWQCFNRSHRQESIGSLTRCCCCCCGVGVQVHWYSCVVLVPSSASTLDPRDQTASAIPNAVVACIARILTVIVPWTDHVQAAGKCQWLMVGYDHADLLWCQCLLVAVGSGVRHVWCCTTSLWLAPIIQRRTYAMRCDALICVVQYDNKAADTDYYRTYA
jgi:hypothetical protein